ncbi:MAG: maleylacetate reductase [Sphaerobacteraceae bacterium]|nr:MAG: maleylacetate reductase [Sphaerobacteraceae bacterium]
MTPFTFSGHAQEVVFGTGKTDDIARVIEPFRWTRAMFVTSGSHIRNGNAGRATAALGDLVVAQFDAVQPHVQAEQVSEALTLASEHEVDVIIGLGGGSVIGMAKALSDRLHEQRTGALALDADPLTGPVVPTVILPTTYAGSEMTPVYGVSGPVNGVRRKITVSGRNVVPRVVIYDPSLTIDMPWQLTGTSAMNALAHCFEALYSAKRDPVSSASALRGIRAIGLALPRLYNQGDDIGARGDVLEGAFLAGSALAQVQMAIHHGVCHVLGGTAGVPHGVANTIVLPHALRFNREVAAAELAEVAITLDLAARQDDHLESADRVIAWLDELCRDLDLPRRLGDYGVTEAQVPELARIAMDGGPVQANPRPVKSADEMETFIRAMI